MYSRTQTNKCFDFLNVVDLVTRFNICFPVPSNRPGDVLSVLEMVYHSARNQFERFRVFLELISRFEFEFRRRGNYFCDGFEFLVCSKLNHTHHVAPPCACAAACLCSHNSNSNVVASVIPDDKYVHFCETNVEGQRPV